MKRPGSCVPLPLFATALLGVASCLPAQMPRPLPGIPIVAPPVPHPALLAQPLMQPAMQAAAMTTSAPAPTGPAAMPAKPPEPDPATVGPKVRGKDLSKAVKMVGKLAWHDRLDEACEEAREQGKPVLWIQGLGDLEGFA